MEIIKRNKTAQRTSFAKAYTQRLLINKNADVEEIEMYQHLLKQKMDSLELIHNSYLDALTDDSEILIEFNLVEEYREKALRIESKSKRVLENIKMKQSNNENSDSGNNSHLTVCENPYKSIFPRLSEIELYEFGGELKDWLTFWNQLKNIHENKNFTDQLNKYHYSIQSTKIKPGGRELVESFPITNENYPLPIERLTERYGRKELLIGTDEKRKVAWLLEGVLDVFPGKDGIIRLVRLRSEKGNILRPIQRLYPLKSTQNYEQVVSETQRVLEVVTEYPELNTDSNGTVPVIRSGREIKPVQ